MTSLRVDRDRLRGDLEALGRIGAHPEGGVTRLAFTDEDARAREWIRARMEEAGLEVRSDPAANLFGRREGRQPDAPVLLAGSHLDTVPRGGIFDGALGVLAALEAVRTLDDEGTDLRHPVEIVVWSDEEGIRFGPGVFGSRAFAVGIGAPELERTDEGGTTVARALEAFGGDPGALDGPLCEPGGFAAYLELHVEQGPVLERSGIPVGVVEGIVGIGRWRVTLRGAANHAGTTPMAERRDAVVAAGRLAARARDLIRATPGDPVGNVGWIRAEPGAANVVAGRATLPVELRALDLDVVERLAERIEDAAREIGEEEGVEVEVRQTGRVPPALTHPALRDALDRAAEEAGIHARRMPSGAGHDAQAVVRAGIPTGMLFVPSRDGISHAPGEWTEWEDCARGAEVLYGALRIVDREGAPNPDSYTEASP